MPTLKNLISYFFTKKTCSYLSRSYTLFCFIPPFLTVPISNSDTCGLKLAHTIKLPTFNLIPRRVYRLEVDQTVMEGNFTCSTCLYVPPRAGSCLTNAPVRPVCIIHRVN